MRLHHLIRRARIATIAAMFAAIVRVRFRAKRTVSHSRFRYSRRLRRPPRSRQTESVTPPLDRRGGEAGARAEPRHPDSAVRPADSGRRRRAGAIVLGAEPDDQLLRGTRKRSSPRPASLSGSATSIAEPDVRQPASASTRRCRWGATTPPPGTTRGSRRRTCSNSFSPQLGSNLNLQIHAAAAAQLRDRSDSPAGRQQQEEPRALRHPARGGVITGTRERSRTRTGICRTRSTTSRRSSSRWRWRSSRSRTTRSASRSAPWRRSTSCRRRPKSRATKSGSSSRKRRSRRRRTTCAR